MLNIIVVNFLDADWLKSFNNCANLVPRLLILSSSGEGEDQEPGNEVATVQIKL
jgi:hypothetical protein